MNPILQTIYNGILDGTAAYAKQIGADGYSPDASRAVALLKSLLN